MSAGTNKTVLPQVERPPFKKTDFRYNRWARTRKSLKQKAKQSKFRVEYKQHRTLPNAVTVDTSKARGSIDLVRLCIRYLHWKEFPVGRRDGKACDIYWHGINFDDGDVPGGKVNKLPGMNQTMRKVNLGRMLDLMRQLFPEEYDFHPRQWFLPQQYAEFSDVCRKTNGVSSHKKPGARPKCVYIVKPDDGTQGEGIYLIQDATSYQITLPRSHVVQEYIANPFLIDGFKFDLRIYVLISTLNPLEVYIAKEGMARFCTIPYEYPTESNIRESFMHLTNYSLNKHSKTYMHSDTNDLGSKRTMSSVFQRIQGKGYDTGVLWDRIKEVVVKTLLAVLPQLNVEMHAATGQHLNRTPPSCFQILGLDILLDNTCKPFLLEANANPSLRIDYDRQVAPGIFEHLFSGKDEEIKRPVVMGALEIVKPQKKSVPVQPARQRPPIHPPKATYPSYPNPMWLMKGYPRKRDATVLVRHEECDGVGRVVEYTPVEDEEEDEEEEYEEEEEKDIFPVIQSLPRDEEASENIYEMIYPDRVYDYESFRILERTSNIFLDALGVRGQLAMGSGAFRNFTRRCRIAGARPTLSNAALDIMFIELVKRWEFMSQELTATLCYQGFLEAYLALARKFFPRAGSLLESMELFMDYCEKNINNERQRSKKRVPYSRFPKISTSTTETDMRAVTNKPTELQPLQKVAYKIKADSADERMRSQFLMQGRTKTKSRLRGSKSSLDVLQIDSLVDDFDDFQTE